MSDLFYVETFSGDVLDIRKGDKIIKVASRAHQHVFIRRLEPEGHQYRGRVRPRQLRDITAVIQRLDRSENKGVFDNDLEELFDQNYGGFTQLKYEDEFIHVPCQVYYDDFQDLTPTYTGDDLETSGHLVFDNAIDDTEDHLIFAYFMSRSTGKSGN